MKTNKHWVDVIFEIANEDDYSKRVTLAKTARDVVMAPMINHEFRKVEFTALGMFCFGVGFLFCRFFGA